jgi:ABC-type uncharacterized transport system permease subunit
MYCVTRTVFLEYLCQITENSPEQASFFLDDGIAARFAEALGQSQSFAPLIFAVAFAIARHSENHCVRFVTPEFWRAMLDLLEEAPFAGRQACLMFLFFVILNVSEAGVVRMIVESREAVVKGIDVALVTMEEDTRMTAFQVVQAVAGDGGNGVWGALAQDVTEYLHSESGCSALEAVAEGREQPSAVLAAALLADLVEGTV